MEDKLCSYIQRELLPADCDIDLQAGDDLLGIGYLDSMKFMRLVQYVEQEFATEVPAEDLVLENFQTVDLIVNYLRQHTGD